MSAHVPAPLLVTHDPALEGDLRRLAAAAGTLLDVVADPLEARSRWSSAPVVLLGPEVLPLLTDADPDRREGVHVVTRGASPDELFRGALAVGAQSVVELPVAEGWLVETLTDTVDGAGARAALVGVVGGCGGAGATTFAAALATAAALDAHPSDRPVTLVDADPLGPGIERVAGLDDVEGAAWGRLLETAGRLGSRSLRAALPRRGNLAVLGWGAGAARVPLQPHVVREVASAAQRGSTLVVVDLPRYPDPAGEELLARCDHVVVVSTLSLEAVASAAQVAARVLPVVPDARLVARGPASALDPEQVAGALGMTLAAVMADQRRLAESVELGLGPLRSRRGPLARAARATLQQVQAPALSGAGAAS